jgi:hypothetical protein
MKPSIGWKIPGLVPGGGCRLEATWHQLSIIIHYPVRPKSMAAVVIVIHPFGEQFHGDVREGLRG